MNKSENLNQKGTGLRRRKWGNERSNVNERSSQRDGTKRKSTLWRILNSYQCTPFVVLVYLTTYSCGLFLAPFLTIHPTFKINEAEVFFPTCCIVVGICICLILDSLIHFMVLEGSFVESPGYLNPSQDGNVVIMTIFGLTGLTHTMMARDTTPVFMNYCGRAMHLGRLSEWTAVVFFVVRISSKLDECYTESEAMRAGFFQLISVLTGAFAMIVDEKYTFLISMTLSHIFFFDIFRDAIRHRSNVPLIQKSTKSVPRLLAMQRAVTMSYIIAVIFTAYTLVWWIGAFHLIPDEAEMVTYSVLDMLIKGIFTSLVIKARVAASVQTEHELSEEIIRKLRAFVQYALHEIRVPLNTMSLATSELKHSQPAQRQVESIKLLESMLEVVSRLLSDVLDFQRIASNRLQLEREPLDIRTIEKSVIEQLAPVIKGKSLQLVKEYRLGDKRSPFVLADRFKVAQVLRNLIENASKFSPAGEKITVRIGPVEEGMIRVEVEDNGVGISAENQQKLFKPFSQIEPGKLQNGGGTGLGLYISRSIVEAHGGELVLESDEGKGAKFSFTLQNVSPPTVISVPLFDTKNAALKSRKLLILVVDDNPVNLKLTADMCKRLGHEADKSCSGESALKRIAENVKTYDVVLMDQNMPGMSGVECTERLMKKGYEGIIMGLTGEEEAFTSMRAAGALSCIVKPVTCQKLREFLNTVQASL